MGEPENSAATERLLPDPIGSEDERCTEVTLVRKVWEEKKKMWVVAGPAIFTRLSTFGVSIITQAFMGHIGPTELAAYALVFTVITRFANGILLGMASALETLCGQSYGAGQYHMLGIYLQRSWLIVLPTASLILPVFLFTTPLLRLLGQDEDIALMAGTISTWMIPILYSYCFSFTLQMFLQSQSKNRVITYWAALTLCFHISFSWLLAMKLQLGLQGVMISAVMAFWIPVFGQLLFISCGGCPDSWKGLSTLAFKDLFPIMRLSASSGIMVCLEVWYNTILVLLTGHMQNAEIAINALAICININGWEMMISIGFMAATGVRVANELGKGSARGASFAIYVVVGTSMAIGAVLFVTFIILRGKVAYIFTESPNVAAAVADLSPLLAFSILLNSVQPVLSGVAIGAGWQKVVAYVNITSYYLVGIPLGVTLGYVFGLGVKGIWMGMIFGVTIQSIVLISFTCRTDWNEQVILAKTRVSRWALPRPRKSENSSESV